MSKRVFVDLLDLEDPKQPGWRLRVEREEGDMAVVGEERVLPERIDSPDASFIDGADCIWLRRHEAEWLRDRLTEMLQDWPPE